MNKAIRFKCISNEGVKNVLTVGKIYDGKKTDPWKYPNARRIYIFECNDEIGGYFPRNLFQKVDDTVSK